MTTTSNKPCSPPEFCEECEECEECDGRGHIEPYDSTEYDVCDTCKGTGDAPNPNPEPEPEPEPEKSTDPAGGNRSA